MTVSDLDLRVGTPLPMCEIHITQALIDTYAELSGDFNPLHVDVPAATASAFSGTIAHGCIPMEPVFQAILRWTGTDALPSGTAIRLRYRAPSRPGDTIRSEAQVASVQTDGGRQFLTLSFACLNQRGERVIDGECDLTP